MVDIAASGGQKDTRTVQQSYQHADAETVRMVVLNPKRVVVGL